MKYSIIAGCFDPLHDGHIEFINFALGGRDGVIILLASDDFIIAKKRKHFMPYNVREVIMKNIKGVVHVQELGIAKNITDVTPMDKVVSFAGVLPKIANKFNNDNLTFIHNETDARGIKETAALCDKYGIGFIAVDNEANRQSSSSSQLLKNWVAANPGIKAS